MDDAAQAVAAIVRRSGVDPGGGLQLADAARVPALPIDPGMPLIVLRSAAGAELPIPGRHARSGAVAALRAIYPADHPVREIGTDAVHRLDELDEERLRDRDWLFPALEPLANVASPYGLPWISARLRAPDGCPWDLRQDHASLRRYVLEEAYEAVDAIERGSPTDLAEELGDLLLQVVLHAQLAAEAGTFDLTDVYRSISVKIVRRHPHVFGDVVVSGAEQVVRNWESIKAAERADASPGAERSFDRLTRALPALAASRELQERVSALGWDWPSIDGVWEKVHEELGELRVAASPAEHLHELGDVLFALVNLGRWLALDPEEALRAANRRWIERFYAAERLARDRGEDLAALDAAGKDRLWDAAKRHAAEAESAGG